MGNLLCRVQQLDVKCKAKTKDNVCVNVVASIQYRALGEKANDAFYKPSNTKGQIKACVLSVIKASVPKLLSGDVFEQKKYIASVIEEELDKAMSTYGYKIVQKLTVDIKPSVKVKRAKNNARKGQVIVDGLKNSTVRVSTNVHAGTSVRVTGNGRRNSAIGISVNVPAGTSANVTCNGFRNSAVGISVNVPGASSKSSAVFIPGVVLVPYAVTPIQGSSAHMP